MTQLNLLPDIKLEYIRAQRMRRRVTAISFLVTAASVVVLILLLGVGAVQNKHLSDLNKDIEAETSELKDKPDVEKILTVQNDIGSLNQLHAQKPAMARVFDYLNQVTPEHVSISDMTIDTTANSVTINGNSNFLSTVNKYVDTLKFTTYGEANAEPSGKAFNNVVLTSIGLNPDAETADQTTSYTISFEYDPAIFDITKEVKLTVPSLTTTRSNVTAPADLFQKIPEKTPAGGAAQ